MSLLTLTKDDARYPARLNGAWRPRGAWPKTPRVVGKYYGGREIPRLVALAGLSGSLLERFRAA